MPTYPNAGYNNPALGQALGNIASLFAPPSPQDQLVAQTLQQQRDTAAAKAAALSQGTPYQKQLLTASGGDPVAASKLAQFYAASSGAPLAAQDPYDYAATGQAGNTIGGRQANMQIGQGNQVVVPAGVLGAAPVTLSNDKADADPSVDTVTAKALQAAIANPNDPAAQAALKTVQSVKGNGGVSVSVGGQNDAAKNIATQVDNSYTSAKAAAASLPVFDRQEAALNQGVITGTGSDLIQKARGVLSTITGVNDPGLEHTQDFVAAAQQNIGNLAKQISGSGHTTNMDINVAKMIEGGDPNYTNAALHEIIRQRRLVSLDQIGAHNALVDQYAHAYPGSADAAGFYRLQTPTTAYPPADRITPENAPQPDAANGGGPAAPGPAVPAAPAAPRSPFGAPPSAVSSAPTPGPISPFNVNGPVAGGAPMVAAPPAPTAQPAPVAPRAPGPQAIARLKANPGERALFEQTFGPGSAAAVLGQ